MANFLSGPIPGQSLTDTPRNAPWERPSEFNTVEEVVKHWVGVLADQETMDDIATVFQIGGDLQTLVKTMMLSGAMKGLHTVEAGMLAGPVVATFIRAAMQSYGITVKETPIDMKEAATAREKARLKMLLDNAIQEALAEGTPESDTGLGLLKETAAATEAEMPTEEAPMEEAPTPATGKGLMARGGNV
jgi:hypothetical protein